MPRRLTEEELAQHERQLVQDGFTIIDQLLDDVEVTTVAAAVQPLQDTAAFGEHDFGGFRTKRVFNLFAKLRELDALALDPSILRIVRSALGASIQLSIASTMEIYPGETVQPIHQDDSYFRLQRPHPPVVCNTMWALTDFTAANGATRLCPGSQSWPRPVDPLEPSIAAEMRRGSVLVWDGALWHGGGANETEAIRLGLSLNFCQGWVRQQENHYLSIPQDLVRELPLDLQKLLGWDTCEFLGFVDQAHPLQSLEPVGEGPTAEL